MLQLSERSTVGQEPSSTNSSDDEDYANVQQAASGNVSDTLVETRANRAKVEALNFWPTVRSRPMP